jgi:hypothetical protein
VILNAAFTAAGAIVRLEPATRSSRPAADSHRALSAIAIHRWPCCRWHAQINLGSNAVSNDASPSRKGEWRILLGADEAALRQALLSAARDRRNAGADVVVYRSDDRVDLHALRQPDKPADATDALSLGAGRYLALVGDRTPAEDSRVLAAFAAQLAIAIDQRVPAGPVDDRGDESGDGDG